MLNGNNLFSAAVHFGLTETEIVIVEREGVAICIALFSDGELDKPIDGDLVIEPADIKGMHQCLK